MPDANQGIAIRSWQVLYWWKNVSQRPAQSGDPKHHRRTGISICKDQARATVPPRKLTNSPADLFLA